MITPIFSQDTRQTTFYGLSTDTKPAAANGDSFIEMDTGKLYLYDADGADWTEFGGN